MDQPDNDNVKEFKYLGTTTLETPNLPFLGIHGQYEILNGWSFWGAPQGYWPISIIAYSLVLVGLYYGFKYIKWRGIVFVGYGVFQLVLVLIVSLCMYSDPLALLFPTRYGAEIFLKFGTHPLFNSFLFPGIPWSVVVFILICIFRTWRPEKRQMTNFEKGGLS